MKFEGKAERYNPPKTHFKAFIENTRKIIPFSGKVTKITCKY